MGYEAEQVVPFEIRVFQKPRFFFLSYLVGIRGVEKVIIYRREFLGETTSCEVESILVVQKEFEKE